MAATPKQPARVCLGVIAGPHGVRGLVKVKSFTEVPEDVAAYGPVTDEAGGQSWTLETVGQAKGVVLVRLAGVKDRNQAEALRGTRLYVARSALPEVAEEEVFYYADLIGLAAEAPDGRPLGQVKAVDNYGAGDLLEIVDPEGKSLLLPFTRAVVPEVDLAAGRLVVVAPEVVTVPPSGSAQDGAQDGTEEGWES